MSRILMIDPEAFLLEALRNSPLLAGHEIVAAAGDVDALRRLRAESYDVVITSPSTTVEEDLVLLDEVRQVRPGARSVVLTGRASQDERDCRAVRPCVRGLLEALRSGRRSRRWSAGLWRARPGTTGS